MMRGAIGRAQSASVGDGVALAGGVALAWRALLLAALLSLALGAGVYETLNAGRSAVPATVRSHGLSRSRAFSRMGLLSLPLAARGPVSAALGGDSPVYRVSASAGGLRAASPAQRLSSSFSNAGVSVSSGATRVSLSLRGVGYGSSLSALGAVAPRAEGNRVVYARPGLSEWYANGPLGLEQGFTLARAPAGRASGPLTLSIALSGNARAALAEAGQSITLTRAGETVLRYTGLSATDARGHALHSWLALQDGRLLVRVDARGAHYPLRIDPFIQQGGKLTAKEEVGEGHFGTDVALSSNGNTALIGGWDDDGGIGAAWVFTRTGSTWTQQGAKLTGSDESGAGEFGFAVSLSANGNTALIGGLNDHGAVGAAWVFTRTGEKWTQQGEKLTGAKESGAGDFGWSVALSSEGNTALIGGPGDKSGVGAAWVFTRTGEKWTQQGEKLTGAKESGAGDFGWSVALSSEGNTALIGGPANDTEVGAAWVFTRTGSTWTQQGEKLTGQEESSEGFFASSVALSADGDTALIGGLGDNKDTGAAWVFTRSGSTWTQQGEKLTGSGESGKGELGYSVALSEDGNTALVGARSDNAEVGAAWVFTRSGETWSQQGEKLTGSGESVFSDFGSSVALSASGDTALIGGPEDNLETGAAWVFENAPTVETGSASEVTPTSATLSATVNPNGETVSECKFEYGTTVSYGSSVPCSSSPGSGSSPVAVSASVTGLAANTTYHFRISATNATGTSKGSDETFTTLLTSASGETKEEKKPAEATDHELSVKASGGTGSVTVGPYGSDIGGAPLAKGTGAYLDVYRGTTSSFTTLEFKDCELHGGKSIWWYDPATGWEPISSPTAVYSEGSPPCITVTITGSTKPDLAQMTGTRFGTRFGELGLLESGKCEAGKDANYTEAKCLTVAEKKGKPDHKGKFEWYPSPVECFPQKDGYYSEAQCLTRDEKKGAPKGKYERGRGGFQATGAVAKLAITSLGTLECKASSSVGDISGQKTGTSTITLTGCKLGDSECASAGEAPGTIQSYPLEAYLEEEGQKLDTEFFQDPLMKFSCGDEELTLKGGFRGQTTGDVNVMSATSESVFNTEVGEQELETVAHGEELKSTITLSQSAKGEQAAEVITGY